MRYQEYLRGRYQAMLANIGLILICAGLLTLTPLAGLITFPQELNQAAGFVKPAVSQLVLGLVLRLSFRPYHSMNLSTQEGGVIVLLSWTAVILFSAWPFMSLLQLTFPQAVFEAVSGWTTTGLSVVDVTGAGKLILLWRSIVQLAGGAGLAIIMMSAIIGPTGVGLSAAEGRGEQLVPQVRQSARLVLTIYTAYASLGIVAYLLAGMSPFDAVNHAFAAVSTGGFSTRPESIGYWKSPAVEGVTIPLMVLGNLSFVTAWLLWKGQARLAARNGEIRLFTALLILSVAVLFVFTSSGLYPHLGKAVRVSIFEVVSALTTTGFSTVSYTNWNGFGILLLIMLMLVGGGTCSTAGGIKQFRIYLLVKAFLWELKGLSLPKAAVQERPIWEGRHRIFVDDARLRQTGVFVFLYLSTFIGGSLVLCACGYSLSDSLFEFGSALGTVGLSVGVTSVSMPKPALWTEITAMFLGRLEFIVIITSLLKLGRDARLLLPYRP